MKHLLEASSSPTLTEAQYDEAATLLKNVEITTSLLSERPEHIVRAYPSPFLLPDLSAEEVVRDTGHALNTFFHAHGVVSQKDGRA